MDKNDPLGIDSMIKAWTSSMGHIMENMTWPGAGTSHETSWFKGMDTVSAETMAQGLKCWQTLGAALATPETLASLCKGAGTMPDICLEFIQSLIAGLSELQTEMVQSISRMEESAHGFENLNKNMGDVWTRIYEKEFQKFFQIPQLGLTREYQERINLMMDRFHLFQANYAGLLRLLALPFQRSVSVMQKKISAMAETGKLPDDPNTYYQMWIKILEGHFMTLFQTPEYVETLTKTVNALAGFSEAKNRVVEDMIQTLPIAPRSEVDELAREVYELKKRIRMLEKQMTQ